MEYITDLEIVITDDFIIGVDVEIEFTIEESGIGWYEYGSTKYYDNIYYNAIPEKITVLENNDYELTPEEQAFLESIDILQWLKENNSEYLDKVIIEIEKNAEY
tara:strand:- start:2895 stop:3206 length:312 start_codon:yes stop_codon:yes gene_type:complete